MKNISHIFFDLDNTLWDAISIRKEALKVVYDEFELSHFTPFEKYDRHFVKIKIDLAKTQMKPQQKMETVFKELSEHFRIDSNRETSALCQKFITESSTRVILLPEVFETLKYLQSKYVLSLIVNGTEASARKKLNASGIHEFFPIIFSGPDLQLPKPSTFLFEKALSRFGVAPENSVMIGDEVFKDLSGAQKIGMNTIHFNHRREPSEWINIQALSELKELLS